MGVLGLSERQPEGQPIHQTAKQSRDSLCVTLLGVLPDCNIANLSTSLPSEVTIALMLECLFQLILYALIYGITKINILGHRNLL